MNQVIKTFEELTTKELYEILRVRAEVFVVEQKCVYQDLDGIDERALHVFLEEKGEILAYLRIFKKNDKQVQIGRVLTIKRAAGLGNEVMDIGIRAAKERFLAEEVYIEAQCYATLFYERLGFQVTSEAFFEDGIPHVQMICKL